MAAAALLACAWSIGGGCVTERSQSNLPGIPVKPAGKGARADSTAAANARSANGKGAAKAQLPTGPVATPAAGRTTATDVQVEVQPLGKVQYDGQGLPLPSPDGNMLAVQEGEPPTWPTILAEAEAQPPTRTRLVVYDISKPPMKRVDFVEPLPMGLMLGRASDDEGFLIEAPRAGGARWIGKVSWATGAIKWLVQGSDVNAYATLTPKGELIYSRRRVASAAADLILRTRRGEESIKESMSGLYSYPCGGAAEEVIYTFRVSRAGTDVEVIRIDRTNPDAPRLADTRQSWRIVNSPDLMVAQQMASTASSPAVGAVLSGSVGGSGESDTLAFFDPRRSRMTRFNSVTGGLEGLVPKSICAAPSVGEGMTPGYFCTSSLGLVFVPRPPDGWAASIPDDDQPAKVLATSYVARAVRPALMAATGADKKAATKDEKKIEVPLYILFGPVKGHDDQLEIVKMAVVVGGLGDQAK